MHPDIKLEEGEIIDSVIKTMKKNNFIISLTLISLLYSCKSDDDNSCPDVITIVTEEDLELAERCGLSPAGPLGKYWVSDSYRQLNKVQ